MKWWVWYPPTSTQAAATQWEGGCSARGSQLLLLTFCQLAAVPLQPYGVSLRSIFAIWSRWSQRQLRSEGGWEAEREREPLLKSGGSDLAPTSSNPTVFNVLWIKVYGVRSTRCTPYVWSTWCPNRFCQTSPPSARIAGQDDLLTVPYLLAPTGVSLTPIPSDSASSDIGPC